MIHNVSFDGDIMADAENIPQATAGILRTATRYSRVLDLNLNLDLDLDLVQVQAVLLVTFW